MPEAENAASIPQTKSHLRRHYGFLRILIALPIFFIGAFLLISQSPKPRITSPLVNNALPLDASLAIDFSWPVSRNLDFKISPNVEGELSFESAWFKDRMVTQAVFTPDFTWDPNVKYEITLTNVKNAIPGRQVGQTHTLNFSTLPNLKITSVQPAQTEIISADTNWQINFDRAQSKFEEYTFQLSPSLDFSAEKLPNNSGYVIRPSQLLAQGQKYALKAFQTEKKYVFNTQEVASMSEQNLVVNDVWQVRQPPGVTKVYPTGTNIPLNANLEIDFSESFAKEILLANLTIEPALAGNWSSQDGKAYIFIPEELKSATTYTVKVKAGTKTLAGGFLAEDVVYQFSTIEPVKIISSTPKNGDKGIAVGSTLKFTFNQPVDHKNAESKFKITPAISGDFSWTENTLNFKPKSPLNFSLNYSIIFASGILAPAGLNSVIQEVINFTTEVSVTRLAVPFHRQEHKLSCEIATLVMALRYRGIDISEQPIIDAIGFDPTPKKNGVWGNPNIAFVGDIDGQQPETGYGVYWEPIAKASLKYRNARAFTNGKLTDITSEVKKGNPVIVWGTAGTGRRIDWKTKTGENIIAITGEHTRIVIGFVGSVENPSKIITLDPLYGEKNFTQSAFLYNWSLLGNSGVVVE
ncbi:MAG: Ig-like domain-containing protein [Patescibacteria group bacterium]|jgi:uncharacterized protein YvpB